MNFLYKATALASLALALALPAQALRTTISVDKTSETILSEFSYDSSTGWYENSVGRTKDTTTQTILGNPTTTTKESNVVYGQDVDGHFRIRLVEGSNPNFATLEMDVSANIKIPDSTIEVNFDFSEEVPVQFVKGNWNDYEAGRQVEYQATREGARILLQMLEQRTKQVLREALGSQPEFTVISVSVTKLEAVKAATWKATQNKIWSSGAISRIVIDVDVNISL